MLLLMFMRFVLVLGMYKLEVLTGITFFLIAVQLWPAVFITATWIENSVWESGVGGCLSGRYGSSSPLSQG